jgi:hypothetical protein
MELAEATRQALLILEEEQISPTVDYDFVSASWQHHLQSLNEVMQSYNKPKTGTLNIYTMRQQRPRQVTETPKLYVFKSSNYNLLRILYEQIHTDERSQFIGSILKLVKSGTTHTEIKGARFPHFDNYTSCLPLLAEFCFRTDNTAAFFASLQDVKLPTKGMAIMLMQIEETIALNYDLFTEKELQEIPELLENLHAVAELQTYKARGPRGGKLVPNPHYRSGFEKIGREIVNAFYGIVEECRKAVFYYVRDGLQKRPNLEEECRN